MNMGKATIIMMIASFANAVVGGIIVKKILDGPKELNEIIHTINS